MCELEVFRRVLQNQVTITAKLEGLLEEDRSNPFGFAGPRTHLAGQVAGLQTALSLLDAFVTDDTRRRLESQTASAQRTCAALDKAGRELRARFQPKVGQPK